MKEGPPWKKDSKIPNKNPVETKAADKKQPAMESQQPILSHLTPDPRIDPTRAELKDCHPS